MNSKKLKYEMDVQVVNTILKVLDRSQIVGVQNAKNLLAIVDMFNNPTNKEELEKDTMEELKNKFEPKKENEKKVPTEK